MIGVGEGMTHVAARERAAAGAPSTHTITITVDELGLPGGSTPPGPVITVNHGANQDVDLYGDHGDTMVIAQGGLNVDGSLVSAANNQTGYVVHFTNVIADHSIIVFWDYL